MKTVMSLLALAFAGTQLVAQVTTGSITGNVVDATGSVVPAATVTLTSVTTNEVHSTKTNASGAYAFVAVQPSAYILRVEQQGFKIAERTNVNVLADDRVSMGDIRLEVGTQKDTIVVEEHATQVATDSSQITAAITSNQLANLTARGREVVSLLRTIPGVSYQADQDSAGGTFGTGTPSIGGVTANANHIAVDGVISNDQGSPNVFSSVTTLDAIGEVKVLLNSYQAEYAGNGGADRPGGHKVRRTKEFPRQRCMSMFATKLSTPTASSTTATASCARAIATTPPARRSAARSISRATGIPRKDKLFGFYNMECSADQDSGRADQLHDAFGART